MVSFSNGPTVSFRPFMIFIDGGYLRSEFKKKFNDENINFTKLNNLLVNICNTHYIQMETIRVYYYDAIVDYKEDEEKHKKQDIFYENIRNKDTYEVKLGRLIKTNNGYRQKGVDVLLAIDMISKAHLNQYDIALLLAGDDDYLDMVKSIKDFTGKRIYGAFFEKNASKRLIESFDMQIPITDMLSQIRN